MSRTVRKSDPIVYGSDCHCDACGIKKANGYNRKVYLENGIAPGTRRPHSDNKRRTRKLLRARLKNELRKEM